ncbi:DUF3995 domain-containing protein [Sphingobacterium sp. SG20118]|uniref:DUF3995 domain-containing protein n=1 Tax=Sphingobacterium TaxID=28453 RepID=UPI0004F6BBB2|nr:MULTISPECIES: DUF3995 domain-containing protein [Sphingobacterium]AIM38037.1 hypothetical protein KO02_16090 [Sphingobacterium sp. ML3W]MDH5825899.1 DUF3995 domain-containing protein [Sphingobacterium faecium]
MEFVLSIVNIVIFLSLALLHLYWVFNGQVGIAASVPTKLSGMRVFTPSRLGTFIVAVGLIVFALTNMAFDGIIKVPVPFNYILYVMWGISVIFLLRFIGDFKYFGITKRFRKSIFARRDTYIYNPICLVLSITHAILIN